MVGTPKSMVYCGNPIAMNDLGLPPCQETSKEQLLLKSPLVLHLLIIRGRCFLFPHVCRQIAIAILDTLKEKAPYIYIDSYSYPFYGCGKTHMFNHFQRPVTKFHPETKK